MIDTGTQFKYFYDILQELYYIVDINTTTTPDKYDKIAEKLLYHISYYNNKTGSGVISLMGNYIKEEETFEFLLLEKVKWSGKKKKFYTKIPFKEVFRNRILDDILDKLSNNEDDYLI